jgi:hypothetical protein
MDHLPGRVHAGIGPPGADDLDRMIDDEPEPQQRRLPPAR